MHFCSRSRAISGLLKRLDDHIPPCAHVSLVNAAVYHCMHYVLVVLWCRAFQCRVEGLFADNADGNTSQVWGGITFILFLIFLYCFIK